MGVASSGKSRCQFSFETLSGAGNCFMLVLSYTWFVGTHVSQLSVIVTNTQGNKLLKRKAMFWLMDSEFQSHDDGTYDGTSRQKSVVEQKHSSLALECKRWGRP